MKSEKLLDLIGQINEEYIEEAIPKTKIVRLYWFKWVALATCLYLLLIGIDVITRDSNKNIIKQDQIVYGITNNQNSLNSYVAPPANGIILIFNDVKNALEECDEEKATFFLAIDIFSDTKQISPDSMEMQVELKRLLKLGYKIGVAERWTYQGDGEKVFQTYIAGYFTAKDLKNFDINKQYGYAFQFARNGDGSPIIPKNFNQKEP